MCAAIASECSLLATWMVQASVQLLHSATDLVRELGTFGLSSQIPRQNLKPMSPTFHICIILFTYAIKSRMHLRTEYAEIFFLNFHSFNILNCINESLYSSEQH